MEIRADLEIAHFETARTPTAMKRTKNIPQRLKPRSFLQPITARLKPGPFKTMTLSACSKVVPEYKAR
jgi:hypothetical protein